MTVWHLCERLQDDIGEEYIHIHQVLNKQELAAYQADKKRYPHFYPSEQFIKKVEENEDTSWHAREQARFDNGTYKSVPWTNEPWYKREHFCHTSLEDPSKVAFTADNQQGVADKQTRMRVGRYLQMISCPNVRHWTNLYNSNNIEVKFAATADEIERVYVNGPVSCMKWYNAHSGSDDRGGVNHGYHSHIHPVRVYAAGDLQVAYIEDDKEVTARALVWPAKKLVGRCYPDDGSQTIALALEKLGYKHAWHSSHERSKTMFDGARLLKIECKGRYVLPYLDGGQTVRDAGDVFIIDSDNWEYEADQLHGLSGESREHCCQCGDPINDDDVRHFEDDNEPWCESCFQENSWACINCGVYYHTNVDSVSYDGNTWCDACAARYLWQCAQCDNFFNNHDERFTIETPYGLEHYCEDCHPQEEEEDADEQEEVDFEFYNRGAYYRPVSPRAKKWCSEVMFFFFEPNGFAPFSRGFNILECYPRQLNGWTQRKIKKPQETIEEVDFECFQDGSTRYYRGVSERARVWIAQCYFDGRYEGFAGWTDQHTSITTLGGWIADQLRGWTEREIPRP